MLCFADESMIEPLKHLWREVFGDPPEYIDFYFTHGFDPSQTAVYLEDGVPVGMLTLLDMELSHAGKTSKAGYIYAVGTLPPYRSRGIAARLTQFAHEQCALRGMCAAILIPAQPSLFGYYEKLGYAPCFTIKETAGASPSGGDESAVRLDEIGVQELYRRRNRFFADCLFAGWGGGRLSYILRENRFLGGHALAVDGADFHGHAVCRMHGGTLHILELAVPDHVVLAAVFALTARFGASGYTVRLRGDSAFDAPSRQLGMIKTLSNTNTDCTAAYLSLGLE